MTTTLSLPGRFLKGAATAATVTVCLGAATLATVAPAEAHPYRHGFNRPHFGGFHRFGFHRFGYGFHRYGFGYRPGFRYGYRPYRRLLRPVAVAGLPIYGYGFHPIHRACAPYAWHHRVVY